MTPWGRDKGLKLTRTKQTNKCTRSTQTSPLFPKRGDYNAKRNEETRGQRAREEFNDAPHSINHKATQNNNNSGTTALERSSIKFIHGNNVNNQVIIYEVKPVTDRMQLTEPDREDFCNLKYCWQNLSHRRPLSYPWDVTKGIRKWAQRHEFHYISRVMHRVVNIDVSLRPHLQPQLRCLPNHHHSFLT